MTHRILILGGTTEARQLAGKLVRHADFSVTLSLAGRTESPVAQGVPVRVGGFGGAEGLAAHLRQEKIDLLIDATHPYAARISANAAKAASQAGVPILALRRPGWEPV
ncbi:cobalt-precorrin-6A reductase, partial [Mesorhizobium sp. M2C.T.Ca.TU.009.01.2.1]